jgi:23S rRNA (uracil1939-C5)-methyltransferase
MQSIVNPEAKLKPASDENSLSIFARERFSSSAKSNRVWPLWPIFTARFFILSVGKIAGKIPPMSTANMEIKKNAIVRLAIDDLAYGGQGVGHYGASKLAIMVDEGLPGDVLDVRIVGKKANHAKAVVERIVQPSPHRLEAPCPLFHECGGCSYLNLDYAEQLRCKQRQVAESLRRIGGLAERPVVEELLASPAVFRYRNKMDLTFGVNTEGKAVIGFHRRNDWRRIIDVETCLLQPEEFDRIVGAVRRFANASQLPVYDRKTHAGFWRHLVMRHSVDADVAVAVLLTSSQAELDFAALTDTLRQECPTLAGVVWAINDLSADVAQAQSIRAEWGETTLTERLGDLRFRISPFSFFQTNSRAAELLYGTVREFLELKPRHSLLDAYCGTGSIGIYCARDCRQVHGVESVREAIWDARNNARLNGLEHCTFLPGMMRRVLPLIRKAAGGGGFDRLVVDPPRGGMHKKALAGLLALHAPLLVYVSCNPTTLARDLQTIAEAGYQLGRVRPIDLFPHTYHIETVVQFRLNNK